METQDLEDLEQGTQCPEDLKYTAANGCKRELLVTRRDFLTRTGMGMGGVALSALLAGVASANAAPPNTKAKAAPLPSKVKHVIHIFASGAPSHVDTFDYKPALEQYRGQKVPGASGVAMPSPYEFKKYGKSGLEISSLLPEIGSVADELCIIKSMKTDVPAHPVAARMMNTGALQLVKPSLGAWVLYGLGTENDNLPGFVTLGGAPEWRQAAFLPSLYQGTRADFARNKPVEKVLLNLRNEFSGSDQQRAQLDLASRLNDIHAEKLQKDEQLEARIQSFELAFRMQTEATDAFDIKKENAAMQALYGPSEFGAKLLCARRLIERGVRFVQVEISGWDHHQQLATNIQKKTNELDKPVAALIKDLKQRGLLESTLIICGGEFGRTPTTAGAINDQAGRDHHAKCFSIMLAGGGVKGGMTYGSTDDLGMNIADKPMHVHDLHATILRVLGFDHTKLTHRYNGRDFRLTDNYGVVANEILG
jgi:hypothetical protein